MRPRLVTDEEILKMARKIFIANGPGVSTEVIAKALGISQPALFKRFKTKQNLMFAAVGPPKVITWIEKMKKGPDERPFKEQLKYLTEEIMKFFEEVAPGMGVIRNSGISPRKLLGNREAPPIIAVREITKWLQRCYKKGLIRKINFNFYAITILGTLHFPVFISSISREDAGPIYNSTFSKNFVKNLLKNLGRGKG